LSENITQAEFARTLGIPRQHLNDIEHGRRNVSLLKAAAIASALGYPESLFVRLTLQSLVDEAGLDMRVEVAS
jgi:transcriptional regulator with XRE-family HTH domain